jgi:hypothetical protein
MSVQERKKERRNKAKLIIKGKTRFKTRRSRRAPKNDDVDVNAKNPGAFAGADESRRRRVPKPSPT